MATTAGDTEQLQHGQHPHCLPEGTQGHCCHSLGTWDTAGTPQSETHNRGTGVAVADTNPRTRSRVPVGRPAHPESQSGARGHAHLEKRSLRQDA